MSQYILYNDDVQVAMFSVHSSVITEFIPQKPELLPKQICHATADPYLKHAFEACHAFLK